MPHRPWLNHERSRYCCATVRNALLIWRLPTASRSAFAFAARYGSTALLVNVMPLPWENGTGLAGFMHEIWSEIGVARPSTTAVEHPDPLIPPTVTADVSSE